MLVALVYLLLLGNAVVALFQPWVGAVLAYGMTLLAPQTIWWWAFEGIRPSLWLLVPTLAGFGLAVLRGKINFAFLNTRLNKCVLFLWFSFTASYFFGPYVDVVNEYRFYDSALMFSSLQKTYVAYVVSVLLIDDSKKLKIAVLAIIVTVAYMTYWANAQYFVYHKFGRLHGPIGNDGFGIYSDENNFAVLFVVGAPFLYYLGRYLKSRVISFAVWAIIPFSWHAVFLTASRGGLLAIATTMLIFLGRSDKKAIGLMLVGAFILAYSWEAGDLMKTRSNTISNYEQEDSASGRIDSWVAATGMMMAHPLTGVGFASYGQAFPDFSDKIPRIAHNTFFQIGGEWGIAAGATYLLLIFSTINRLRKNGTRLRLNLTRKDAAFFYYLNESCLLALTGFFACSMFLSLQGYELFYYLLLIANATLLCSAPVESTENEIVKVPSSLLTNLELADRKLTNANATRWQR